MSTPPAQSGGFILSPPPSVTSAITNANSELPHPRSTPLKPGGSKESAFIRYVDERLLRIQRRFAKRETPSINGDEADRDGAAIWDSVQGYKSMREACKDIEELMGVVWVSGTPGLQIPYLINLALVLTTIIADMPANPKQLFRVLAKLDHAFAGKRRGKWRKIAWLRQQTRCQWNGEGANSKLDRKNKKKCHGKFEVWRVG
jgi:hypothetical protein